MARKKKLDKATLNDIHSRMAKVTFFGTPENQFRDSGFWEFLKYVKTKDEHDYDNPVKPLNMAENEYLQVVWLHMLMMGKLLIPKSRQIKMSWAACVFATWFARTAPHRLVIFQSKKKEDAEEMVSLGGDSPGMGRMDVIEQNLPWWLRDYNIVGKDNGKSGPGNKVGQLIYSPHEYSDDGVRVPWFGSRILAVAQGADQVASKTVSLYLGDETAFWDTFQESWGRVSPAVRSGRGRSKMFGFSSVMGGSDFNNMVLENPRAPQGTGTYIEPENTGIREMDNIVKCFPAGQLPIGMRSWETPSKLPVLEVHYTADVSKRPGTPAGDSWIKSASEDYVGGVDSPLWRREYEIKYGSMGGTLVFPELYSPTHKTYIPEISWKQAKSMDMAFYAGYDHGQRSPSAMIVWGQDPAGTWYALWELFEVCKNYVMHCNNIKVHNPFFSAGLLKDIKCDPDLTKLNQLGRGGVKTSVHRLMGEEGVHMTPGQKGADLALVSLMKFWLHQPKDQSPEEAEAWKPKVFITSGCPNLRRELQGLRYEEHSSAAVARRKNLPERIMDINNHAFDASAYILTSRPKPPDMPRRGGFSLHDYRAETRRQREADKMEREYVRL